MNKINTAGDGDKRNTPWFLCIPLIVMAGIVPLVVRLNFVPVDPAVESVWLNEKTTADFFSYCKSLLILASGLFSALIIIYFILKGKIRVREYLVLIPLGCYALMTVVSAALSKQFGTALLGFPQRYEGALVLLAYSAAFLLSFYLSANEKAVKLILGVLFISAFIISSIGILQFIGIDLFKSQAGRSLIIPSKYANLAQNLSYKYGEGSLAGNTVCSTLFNSNTLGNYLSMVLPLLITFFIASDNRRYRILYGLSCAAAFACLIGSQSRGGYLGVVVALVALIIIARNRILAGWKENIAVCVALLIIAVSMDILNGGSISNRIISMVKGEEPVTLTLSLDKIRDFKIDGGNLTLFTKNTILRSSINDKGLSFYDENDKELELRELEAGKKFEITDNRYKGYLISVSNNLINFERDKSFLNFCVQNGTFQFVDARGRVVKPVSVEKLGFNGMERFASSRGYVWSRTIPLLKNTLVLGHGPDTFAMYFPQYDYMGKLNYMYDANLIVDKPHNMFLQIGVNTGVVSLLAFLALILLYIKFSLTSSSGVKFSGRQNYLVIGAFVAVIGYLVSGMFTDSTVSVSPVFWVIFGLGFGISVRRFRQKSR